MKYILSIVLTLFIFNITNAQSTVKKIDNKTYQQVSKSSSSYIETDMVYIDKNGEKYTIYTHEFSRGDRKGQTGYFIRKISKKSGRQYWKEVKLS